MKIRCTKQNGFRGTVYARHGEVLDLPDAEAEFLLNRYPVWFEKVSEAKAEAGEGKAFDAPPRSKPFGSKRK